MATGVLSSIFHSFPYGGNSRAMNGLSLGFFFLGLLLFCIFFVMSLMCFIMYPRAWWTLLRHPVYSLYLGCFPIGVGTLLNVAVVTVHEYWDFGGLAFVYVIWGFWWLDSFLSLVCAYGLIFLMCAPNSLNNIHLTSSILGPHVISKTCRLSRHSGYSLLLLS